MKKMTEKNINRYISVYIGFESRLQKVTEGFVQQAMMRSD